MRWLRRACWVLAFGAITYLSAYAAIRADCFPGFYAETHRDRCLIRCYPSSPLSVQLARFPIPLMRVEGYLTGRRMDYLRNFELITVYDSSHQ